MKKSTKTDWQKKYNELYCKMSEQNESYLLESMSIINIARNVKSRHSKCGKRCRCDVCVDMDKILKTWVLE